MTIFSKMIEDPMYDEDGVMIDEDAEWEDLEDVSEWLDKELKEYDATYSPYDTINS